MGEKTEKRERFESRRQRRVRRRRQQIIDAAARVFAAKGYANATTKEIAEEADIGESTIYNYFDSKREILFAIADETDPPMLSALLEMVEIEDRETLIKMFAEALNLSKGQRPFALTLLSEAWLDDDILEGFIVKRLERVHQRLEAYIAGQVEAGIFRSIDPAMVAWLMLSMFGGLALAAVRGVGPLLSPEQRRALAETGTSLFLDGLCVREA